MSRQAADNPQRHEKIDKKLFYEGFLATNGIICGQLQTWKIRDEGSKITFTIRAPANKYLTQGLVKGEKFCFRNLYFYFRNGESTSTKGVAEAFSRGGLFFWFLIEISTAFGTYIQTYI